VAGPGGLLTIEKYHTAFLEGDIRNIAILHPDAHHQPGSGTHPMKYGAKGPNIYRSQYATGTPSIGDAHQIIRRGDADAMIAGGTESTVTPSASAALPS
jgi:3-oxoacyl-[acyl-carrier-protein] synthase II